MYRIVVTPSFRYFILKNVNYDKKAHMGACEMLKGIV